jgi:cytochrome c oxidase subunit 4
MNEREFRRHVRHLGIAWIALILLMLASLGSAYLNLGVGNLVAGVVIAIVKSAIIVGLFMGLARSQALVRLVAAAALGCWFLLLTLGGLDQLTRARDPSVTQPARQLAPTLEEKR